LKDEMKSKAKIEEITESKENDTEASATKLGTFAVVCCVGNIL